jgi:hypothetical protein
LDQIVLERHRRDRSPAALPNRSVLDAKRRHDVRQAQYVKGDPMEQERVDICAFDRFAAR